jgi:GR25 family glycosyltransferase involved in LPS biosynthesis
MNENKYKLINPNNTFIINLDSNNSTYINSINYLKKLHIKPTRFEAIDCRDINNISNTKIKKIIQNKLYPSVKYTIENGSGTFNNIPSWGAIGCYLSHVFLWEKLLKDPFNDYYIIFEDDIYPNILDRDELDIFVKKLLRIGFDFCYLGHKSYVEDNGIKIKKNPDIVKITKITAQTHAYIISKNGAKELLKYVFPIVDQIDAYISFVGIEKNLEIYKTKKQLFCQNILRTAFNSSIQKPFSYSDELVPQIIHLYKLDNISFFVQSSYVCAKNYLSNILNIYIIYLIIFAIILFNKRAFCF